MLVSYSCPSGLVDSAQNLKESTQASRPGAADGSLAGENVTETGPSERRGITYEVTLDVNSLISKHQIGKFSLDFSGISSLLDGK